MNIHFDTATKTITSTLKVDLGGNRTLEATIKGNQVLTWDGIIKKISICHVPPGNPSNPQTISISENAWKAHEKHGDYIGECKQGVESTDDTIHEQKEKHVKKH